MTSRGRGANCAPAAGESRVKVIFVGDIVSSPGRRAFAEVLPRLRREHAPDFVVVNGENAAGGLGITPPLAVELFEAGADCLTSGNHIWHWKEISEYLSSEPRLIRPANYPPGAPGSGLCVLHRGELALAVINLQGRVFMDAIDCPFRKADELLDGLGERAAVLVDFHAEATSEKIAMGFHLDGRVSAVVGTHTHVQTADEKILPGGTGYITDCGMTGPHDSVIGMRKEIILQHFITQLPIRFDVAKGGVVFQGVLIEIGRGGACTSIKRLSVPLAD